MDLRCRFQTLLISDSGKFNQIQSSLDNLISTTQPWAKPHIWTVPISCSDVDTFNVKDLFTLSFHLDFDSQDLTRLASLIDLLSNRPRDIGYIQNITLDHIAGAGFAFPLQLATSNRIESYSLN